MILTDLINNIRMFSSFNVNKTKKNHLHTFFVSLTSIYISG